MAPHPHPQPKTDTERCYRGLRRDILHGVLAPDSKLKVVPLRERYGVGAGALREALSRLAGDQLVVRVEQRGFSVAPMSASDAADLGRMRAFLECEALAMSIPKGGDDWEADVVAAFHRLGLAEERHDIADIERQNQAFHDALVAAAGSPRLLEMRAQIYVHQERYRYLSRRLDAVKSARDTPAEHKAIYGAALARDVALAQELTRAHIARTTEMVVASIGVD